MPREGPSRPTSILAGSQWNANAATPNPISTHNATTVAIKTINNFLSGFTISLQVENAWKCVQEAAKRPAGHQCLDATKAINKTINDSYTHIETLLKAKASAKAYTYAEAAGSQRGPSAQALREALVPTQRQREIVVARGAKTLKEKHCNSKELVEDLNKGENKGILAARQLLSKDVLVTAKS